jgi:hypothetical protein
VTPDEVNKATTPNALRDASPERLDDLCNHAKSLLLSRGAGAALQMQAAIYAIHAEKARRQSRKAKWIEWLILIATLVGVAVEVVALYRTAK